MYCVKCRHVTETENIAMATSKNGRLMRRGQCTIGGKIKTQFNKKGAASGRFLNTLLNNLPFEMHLPGNNFTGPETKSAKG